MVAGTVRYSTMIPVPVATLYPLKYRRRYFWEFELDPGAGAVDTAKNNTHRYQWSHEHVHWERNFVKPSIVHGMPYERVDDGIHPLVR